jgi:hypothetical protein
VNQKKAKQLRRQAKQGGFDPADKRHEVGRYRDVAVPSDRIVRVPDSGRSVYQQLKKLS